MNNDLIAGQNRPTRLNVLQSSCYSFCYITLKINLRSPNSVAMSLYDIVVYDRLPLSNVKVYSYETSHACSKPYNSLLLSYITCACAMNRDSVPIAHFCNTMQTTSAVLLITPTTGWCLKTYGTTFSYTETANSHPYYHCSRCTLHNKLTACKYM